MRILYATEGSSNARAAGMLLAGLQLTPKDHITVFAVDDRSGDIDFVNIFKGALAALSGTAAAIETRKGEGFTDEAILDQCQESAVELLVLGSKGVSERARFLLGSVTARVLRYAPCSVLIARPREASIRNVLLAFDGSAPARAAAAMLLQLPLAPETRVHLMTVLPPLDPNIPQREPVYLHPGLDELKVVGDLAQIKDDFLAAGRPAKTHTVRGDAASCLLDYAQSEEIDLIVLGAYGTSLGERIYRFLLGSTSEKVARYANCSVLLVRQPGK